MRAALKIMLILRNSYLAQTSKTLTRPNQFTEVHSESHIHNVYNFVHNY